MPQQDYSLYELPVFGPAYITIANYYDIAEYNLTVSYLACTSGYGYPNCSSPWSTVTLSSTLPQTLTASNIQENTWLQYFGKYVTLTIPPGSTGYLNMTCTSTNRSQDAWVALNAYSLVDCNQNYAMWFACSDIWEPYSPMYLMSENLYGGGKVSIGLCKSEPGLNMTITIDGNVTFPSPSPSASPATTGNSTGSQDSGAVSSGVQVALAMFLFAALVLFN